MAPGTKRLATGQTTQNQSDRLPRGVEAQALQGVNRTSRLKPTSWGKQGWKPAFVQPNAENHEGFQAIPFMGLAKFPL